MPAPSSPSPCQGLPGSEAPSGEAESRPLLSALQARPRGLLKPWGRLPGRLQLHQVALPTLPVPPLQQTLDRYLLALEPIVSREELSHTQQLVAEFRRPGGVGERLQKGLERRAKKTENWVCWEPGPGHWLGRGRPGAHLQHAGCTPWHLSLQGITCISSRCCS